MNHRWLVKISMATMAVIFFSGCSLFIMKWVNGHIVFRLDDKKHRFSNPITYSVTETNCYYYGEIMATNLNGSRRFDLQYDPALVKEDSVIGASLVLEEDSLMSSHFNGIQMHIRKAGHYLKADFSGMLYSYSDMGVATDSFELSDGNLDVHCKAE